MSDDVSFPPRKRKPGPPKGITPPWLVGRNWQKGTSGNPGGKTTEWKECLALARQAAPDAMKRLIELINAEDERVALVACEKVIERAWGKVREKPPEDPLRHLSPTERHAKMLELLAFAASLETGASQPPMIEHEAGG